MGRHLACHQDVFLGNRDAQTGPVGPQRGGGAEVFRATMSACRARQLLLASQCILSYLLRGLTVCVMFAERYII